MWTRKSVLINDAVLTFEPLSPGAPASCTESAAQLLEVHMSISVLIESEEGARDCRRGERGGEERSEALDVQLAGRGGVTEWPETFLQFYDVLKGMVNG